MSNTETVEITIPENAHLMSNGEKVFVAVGTQLWNFAVCVEHVVNTSPRFNATGQGIRASVRILAAIENKAAGDKASLRKDDLKMLADEMEAPTAGWMPPLVRTMPDGTTAPFNVPGRAFAGYLDAVSVEKP